MGARAGTRADFDEFVAVCSERLLRTACLLTGDRGTAEDLLERALARAWLDWKRLDVPPEPHVCGLLAREWAPRWAPSTRRRRAVVVLRCAAGLSEEDTADVLGCSVAAVRRHLAGAVADSGGVDRLRAALAEEAAAVGGSGTGTSMQVRLARLDRRTSSGRWRRRSSAVASGALVAAAVVAAVALGGGRSEEPRRERPPDGSRHVLPAPPLLAGYQLDPLVRVSDMEYEYVRSVESAAGQRRLRMSVAASSQPYAVAWVSPVALDGEIVVSVDGYVVRRDRAGSFQSGLLLSTRRPHVVELRATATDVSMRLGLALYRWPPA